MARQLPQMDLASTGIGALPHTEPDMACRAVLEVFHEVPYIPTLPNRNLMERIVFTDSEYLPGAMVKGERLWVDTDADHSDGIEKIFLDYLEGNSDAYRPGIEYASGFYAMMKFELSDALLVKCQVTGPVTFGMQVVDQNKRPIHYDSEYADVLGKLIGLRARWYEQTLRSEMAAARTLIVLNEPYLAALGSSVVPLNQDVLSANIADISSLLEGSFGIHCCSNTDWGFLMKQNPGLISFDAYSNAREFLLYGDEMATFMESGGVVAWGIVPAEYDLFKKESTQTLLNRLIEIRKKACEFLDEDLFNARSMITPTCGIRFADEEQAVAIMKMTDDLSRRMRSDTG